MHRDSNRPPEAAGVLLIQGRRWADRRPTDLDGGLVDPHGLAPAVPEVPHATGGLALVARVAVARAAVCEGTLGEGHGPRLAPSLPWIALLLPLMGDGASVQAIAVSL